MFLELTVEGHSQQTSLRIQKELNRLPEVIACHIISGTADFLVEVAVPHIAAYERLLLDEIQSIPSVITTRSTFAIRTVKSHGRLPVANP